MLRRRWILSGFLALLFVGPLSAVSPTNAGAVISRPVVWVSGQDSGKVFITQGTTILTTFDFVAGTPVAPVPTPVITGVGAPGASPKPHLIEFSPDGQFAYVSFQNTNPGKVAVIDTTTRTVVTVITIQPNPGEPVTPGTPTKVTQAKASPDGSFLLVTEIGPPGALTRIAVDQVARTWNQDLRVTYPTGMGPGLGFGPACTSFKPDGSVAYVDSSLSPFKGVKVVDPNTLAATDLFSTLPGDPQCGIHNPIILDGVPKIVVTDNGGATGPGHVHVIDTTNNSVIEPPPSPIVGGNLHDNWPVGLQPVGASTTDPANTVYASDRDLSTLHKMRLGEPNSDSSVTIVDPSPFLVPEPPGCGPTPNPVPCTFDPRGAPDTLDGSGDTVFVAMKEAGDLGIIDNNGTQTYLHLADPARSCGVVGNTNFHKCFAVHAVTVQPTAAGATCNALQVTIPAGTAGNDRIFGTSGKDVIMSFGGNDQIYGNGGDDTICAGTGNDVVYGGLDNDYIDGASGDDRVIGDAGDDDVRGGPGDDRVFGSDGTDKIDGGPNFDYCYKGTGGLKTVSNCEVTFG